VQTCYAKWLSICSWYCEFNALAHVHCVEWNCHDFLFFSLIACSCVAWWMKMNIHYNVAILWVIIMWSYFNVISGISRPLKPASVFCVWCDVMCLLMIQVMRWLASVTHQWWGARCLTVSNRTDGALECQTPVTSSCWSPWWLHQTQLSAVHVWPLIPYADRSVPVKRASSQCQ